MNNNLPWDIIIAKFEEIFRRSVQLFVVVKNFFHLV